MNFILLIAAVIGGVLLSAQSSVNGALSRKAGTYEPALAYGPYQTAFLSLS